MKCLLCLLLFAAPALAQVDLGQLQLRISDPSGLVAHAAVELVSAGNGYDKTFVSDERGEVTIREAPYGLYRLEVRGAGLAPFSKLIQVHFAHQAEVVQLSPASVTTQVHVTAGSTLTDPGSPSSVMRIGTKEIEERVSSLPGRSIQDLVISEPGWLYEGNAVLHPRGSEYQTQLVVDGIPLTDNRSPSFGPEIEADDLESLSIYTAGFPAEYGRKMGGVIELNTRRQPGTGLHGHLVLSGGSYDSASSYGQLQEEAGKNILNLSASGSMSDHYLNPVVPENYTNTGTTGDFSAGYTREPAEGDSFSFNVRHELSRFLIPDELLQQQAGQVQNGDNFETLGTVRYQHTLSADSLVALSGLVRDNANDLESNQKPRPIAAFQHNDFREGYFKAVYSLHRGRQDFKAGLESDAVFLHENFNYTLTDPTQFDPGTPPGLSFVAQRPDLEQSAFVEDMIRLGAWTISAGLRWDHYQLLLNQNAFSPRLSIGRSLPGLGMVLHASFDRIFQTPSFENLLISSSASIDALSSRFLRLPVQPSRGNFYEGGLSENLWDKSRLDVNVYRRDARNYADDDQLRNTGISYPVAFDKAVIYGAEGKLTLVQLQNLNGFISYSYMVGSASFPVTGGLFLGQDAASAAAQLSGHFPDSQDQRNTLTTRFQYQFLPHLSVASGALYGSGLPFAYGGDEQDALSEYGPQVISRINFNRGRIRPLLAVNASVGADLYTRQEWKVRLQVDGENLNDRLNVIDFGGLFSGNAIGPARSFAVRLNTNF